MVRENLHLQRYRFISTFYRDQEEAGLTGLVSIGFIDFRKTRTRDFNCVDGREGKMWTLVSLIVLCIVQKYGVKNFEVSL